MYDMVIKVLLIEDDEDDYVMTRSLLTEIEGAKFELTWITNYEEALEAIRHSSHDVCLIDYRLGEHNGVELLSKFRARGYLTPAILLTGMADQHIDHKAMRVGASDYLIKDHINKTLLERSIRYAIERHKTLEALRQSENRFRRIVETTSEGIWTLDAEARTSYVNQRMTEMLGYKIEEMLGHSYYDFMDEEAALQASQRLSCRRHGIAEQYELQLRHRDGSACWMIVSANPMFDENDEFTGSLGMLTDITERKLIEEALRESDRRAICEYAQLVEKIAALAQALGVARELSVIYRALRDFSVASVPCTGFFITLYDQKRNERRAAYAWSDGEDVDISKLTPLPMNESPNSRAVSTGQVIITDDFQAATASVPVINVGLERDPRLPQSSLAVPMTVMGKIVGSIEVQSIERAAYTQEHATAMRMAANLAANAIENIQLIERERQHDDQLRQSQKMEAIGHLAGGVAHDFNNLLTAINGYADLALRRAQNNLLRRQLEEIKKAGERASALTRQLLAFSRKQVLQPKVLNLNEVVRDTYKMLHRLVGEDILMTTSLSNDLGNVNADPGQIEQILMNLVLNAKDAMPTGGRIMIKTENIEMDEEIARKYNSVRSGPHIRLSVSDTGCGMSAETQERIFEPFFTTKEVGKGTGLGLSTVYGIVKQSGGYISAYSEEGCGTTFKIYLPRIDEATDVKEIRETEVISGDETVLLAEDDEMVRKIAYIILKGYGYEVLATSNGTEALQTCKEHAGRISLMVTDVVMPQMSGKELAEQVRQLRPNMQVLYMSGYTDDIIVHHGVLEAGIPFLEKPFTPEALARKVRQTLDASPEDKRIATPVK
jgi:two-component system, cell cycle sensor histidine kinase and response regulator CckA